MKRIAIILVSFVYLVAVITVAYLSLNVNHMLFGTGFTGYSQTGDSAYVLEQSKSSSVIYRGDFDGKVTDIAKFSGFGGSLKVIDMELLGSLYVLCVDERGDNPGYRIIELNRSLKKDYQSVLLGVDDGCFPVSLNIYENFAYITCVENGDMKARVYEYNLDELISTAQIQNDDTATPEIQRVVYSYESVTGRISEHMPIEYDGNTIKMDLDRSEEQLILSAYAAKMELGFKQAFNINMVPCMIFAAIAIIGVLLIILIANLIAKRSRIITRILLYEAFVLLGFILMVNIAKDVVYPLIWFIAMSMVIIVTAILENRDIRVLCQDMKRISAGNYDIVKPRGNANETQVFWRGMNELKYQFEKYKYMNGSTVAAAMRFIPNNLGEVFGKGTLDEIKSGDKVNVNGIMMLFKTGSNVTSKFISALEEYENTAGGMLISGTDNLSELKMLFYKAGQHVIQRGLDYSGRIINQDYFVLYFKDDFTVSVSGSESRTLISVTSDRFSAMEEYAEWFSGLKLRVVITEKVKNSEFVPSPIRFIGYMNNNGELLNFYEVINAYPESIRENRLRNMDAFSKALGLFYGSDFYLARTAFSEILKSDPVDEISRWYLFMCEKFLENYENEVKDFSLVPDSYKNL